MDSRHWPIDREQEHWAGTMGRKQWATVGIKPWAILISKYFEVNGSEYF
jgi:hypothetical protein